MTLELSLGGRIVSHLGREDQGREPSRQWECLCKDLGVLSIIEKPSTARMWGDSKDQRTKRWGQRWIGARLCAALSNGTVLAFHPGYDGKALRVLNRRVTWANFHLKSLGFVWKIKKGARKKQEASQEALVQVLGKLQGRPWWTLRKDETIFSVSPPVCLSKMRVVTRSLNSTGWLSKFSSTWQGPHNKGT